MREIDRATDCRRDARRRQPHSMPALALDDRDLRGSVALSPDRTRALVRDGVHLTLRRAARVDERVGKAIQFESTIASVAWHATRDVCAVPSSPSTTAG
jgi:hypothetical protein